MIVYLDNAATTKPCQACVDAVTDMLTEDFGNPSSFHGPGVRAHRALEQARALVAASLGAADESEIIFTSGGTEANNLALFGSAYANRRKGNRIVMTAVEHESVLETGAQLEKEGFEVVLLQPDRFGNIVEKQLETAINSETILVSMMYVNNEVGSILPVPAIRKYVKRTGAPAYIHIDAVQAYGKLPLRVRQLGADLVTVSAHKIHGPKGVGALYVKKGTALLPRTYGGQQEQKLRPGTESVPLIAGFGAAVQNLPEFRAAEEQVRCLRDFLAGALSAIPGIVLNSGPNASPYVLNFAVDGLKSQTLIQDLSRKHGVCISNGSACAKGKKSHVLIAMGLPADRIDSSIRVSFSRYSTREDVEALLVGLQDAMAGLARKSTRR